MRQHGIYDKLNLRIMVEGILYRLRVGCPWRDLPLVENVFARLKHFRAIATRYDKLKRNYASMVALACVIWGCQCELSTAPNTNATYYYKAENKKARARQALLILSTS
jgi:transposase